MNTGQIATALVSVMVCGLLVGLVGLPIINSATSTTIEIKNDGASWLRMTYSAEQEDFAVNYDLTGDSMVVDSQTGEFEEMILYADSSTVVALTDDGVVIVTPEDVITSESESFTISRTGGTVYFDNEEISSNVEWAYYPKQDGHYAYFDASTTPLTRDGTPLVAYGSFAGVYCYNDHVSMDLGFVMDADVTSSTINSVRWGAPSEDLSTESILPVVLPGTILPLDPNIDLDLDTGNEVGLMSVPPTPSYTDGDWGYNINNDGVTATVVSYSGPSGANVDIVIPDMVGGHTVNQVGGGSVAIFDTSKTFGSLTLPSGVKYIGAYAFNGCSGFTGTLTIPSGVISINQRAFNGCSGFTGTLTIPSGVTNIYTSAFSGCSGFTGTLTIPSGVNYTGEFAFENCTGLTGLDLGSVRTISQGSFKGCAGLTNLTIPASVTSINNNAFYGCSGLTGLVVLSDCTPYNTTVFQGTTNLKEVLNLGTATYTTTSYGLNADEVRTDIPVTGYVCLESYYESKTNDDPTSTVLSLLPLLLIVGVVLIAIALFIRSKM